jgi:hypothetical protein
MKIQRDAIKVSEIDPEIVKQCWEFVQERRKGKSMLRPGPLFVRQVCEEFGQQNSLNGVEYLERRRRFSYVDKSTTVEVSDAFVAQVEAVLPPQPWPRGTHLDIARTLGVSSAKVTAAIFRLIATGRWFKQVGGELFDSSGKTIIPRQDE